MAWGSMCGPPRSCWLSRGRAPCPGHLNCVVRPSHDDGAAAVTVLGGHDRRATGMCAARLLHTRRTASGWWTAAPLLVPRPPRRPGGCGTGRSGRGTRTRTATPTAASGSPTGAQATTTARTVTRTNRAATKPTRVTGGGRWPPVAGRRWPRRGPAGPTQTRPGPAARAGYGAGGLARPCAAGRTSAGRRPGSPKWCAPRFGVGYTLAGLDLLLHRTSWSRAGPRAAGGRAGRGEDRRVGAVAAIEDRGGPGRLALLRGRSGPGPAAAEGPHLGLARPDPGGAGDRGRHPPGVAGRARVHQPGSATTLVYAACVPRSGPSVRRRTVLEGRSRPCVARPPPAGSPRTAAASRSPGRRRRADVCPRMQWYAGEAGRAVSSSYRRDTFGASAGGSSPSSAGDRGQLSSVVASSPARVVRVRKSAIVSSSASVYRSQISSIAAFIPE
jgi:hypothetical protein